MPSKKEIKEEIVWDLLEDLRDMPDGSRTSVDELLADSFHADTSFSENEIAYLKKLLFKNLSRIKIEITQLEDGAFIVNNQAAKYVCPHCGSTNTAPILYGFPAFSPQMVKKLDVGRLHLGGCEIWPGRPDRYCNDCEKDFNTTQDIPDILNEFSFDILHDDSREIISSIDHPELAEAILLTYENFGNLSVHVAAFKNDSGFIFKKERGPYKYQEPEYSNEEKMLKAEWDVLLEYLYNRCEFNLWKHEYNDPDILDGINWKVSVFFPGMKKQESQGRNVFPEKLGEFIFFFYNMDEYDCPGFPADPETTTQQ